MRMSGDVTGVLRAEKTLAGTSHPPEEGGHYVYRIRLPSDLQPVQKAFPGALDPLWRRGRADFLSRHHNWQLSTVTKLTICCTVAVLQCCSSREAFPIP